MSPIDQFVVACLAAIGIFTTTFSIIEPRPLLAISHQAHAIVNAIWYSFQRLETPLALSDDGNITLNNNDTAALHYSVPLTQTVTSNQPVASPHTVALLHTGDGSSQLTPLPAKTCSAPIFSTESPSHQHQILLQYLVVICLAALCIVLFIPIKVPTNLLGKSRVKATQRAVKGSRGNQWSILDTITDSFSNTIPLCITVDTSARSLDNCMWGTPVQYSTSDEQHYLSLLVLNDSLYLEITNLKQELEAAVTSKEVVKVELEPLREQNVILQKEITNSKELNTRMQAKSSDHGRKMKALECHLQAKDKDIEELAVQVARLSDDLSYQVQQLKTKTRECIEMERKATAQAESEQCLKHEVEATKLQLSDNVDLLKSTEQSLAEMKQQESSTKRALSTVQNENIALSASLTHKSDKLCKSIALCKSAEQKFAQLEKCEANTKTQLESALSQNRALLASRAVESDLLRQCKEELGAEHEEKLDIEKQLATLCKEKADVEHLLMAASRDHSEVKELLSVAHAKQDSMMAVISSKDYAYVQICGDFTQYRADHQVQVDGWMATQNNLLLQADQSLRLQKAAQAEAAEAKRALLQHQAARANAFTTIAMIAKKRSDSGQSASTSPSESSPPTSPDTKFGGSHSQPVLNASAIVFKPKTNSGPVGTVARPTPVHEQRVRKGRLARQLRRPSKASRVAKPELQMFKHVSLKLPRIRLRLPSSGRFSMAGNMLDVTVWRMNNTALIGIHSVHFFCDMSHLRSKWSIQHLLNYFHQSARTLAGNVRKPSIHNSVGFNAVLGTSSQSKNRSPPTRLITLAKALPSKIPSTTQKDLVHTVNVAPPKEKRSAPKAKSEGQLFSSQWAPKAPKAPILPNVVEAAEEKCPAPKAKPEGQLFSSQWAPKAPKAPILPTVVEAVEEKRPATEAETINQPTYSPVTQKASTQPVRAVTSKEQSPAPKAHHTKALSSSAWAPVAAEASIKPVNIVASVETHLLRETRPEKQLASSVWAKNSASQSAQVPKQRKSEIPCIHFAKGRCRNGKACPYKHDAKAQKPTIAHPDLAQSVSFDMQVEQRAGQIKAKNWLMTYDAAKLQAKEELRGRVPLG
jgi:hypothetical protein